MYKFIKTSVVGLLLLLTTACERELLETIPNDRLSVELFWKTEQDAILATNAVYTYLEGTGLFSWDGMTDIGHTNQSFATEALIEKGQTDALNSKVLTEWTNAYKGIRAANSFFKNVDQIQAQNPNTISRLKGEVKVLRAYLYLKLVSLYGEVPLITDEISLEESRQVKRVPAAQIWDFIAAELTEAAPLLPVTQEQKGRITKGAALGLKARALLYAGRYQGAAEAAKEVMDLNAYSLHPAYQKLFSYEAENNGEILLDKQFIKDTYNNNIFATMAPYSQQASTNTFVPTKNLVDAYTMNNGKEITDPASGFDPKNPYLNRDPRLKYSIYVPGEKLPDGKIFNSVPGSGTADAVGYSYITTTTGFTVKKYINAEDLAQPANGGINIILMRYAEVLLTYAEAKIELNQLDKTVLDAINLVRQRADVAMPPITDLSSQAALRKIVRRERLVELAFEGLRYFDLRRWRIAEEVMPGKVYGMTYVENGTLKTVEAPAFERSFNKNRDYLWPIPQKERDLNPGLTQNPNW
ncbi:putative outer membrane starch-binding protein [Larkinella arboricola]|uniref:Putative outer membrane starch-binding protein n=1 Tax=Larkinella arboricola TaxID=643671 RepID=A0A327WPV6_LARAB|nr:RagB/SusD family nutrient uptake outer membrane protein [Larkinella arboricola]RAJ94026.1 putative outer membrane starch-binding protein [Larkinella arboricola]